MLCLLLQACSVIAAIAADGALAQPETAFQVASQATNRPPDAPDTPASLLAAHGCNGTRYTSCVGGVAFSSESLTNASNAVLVCPASDGVRLEFVTDLAVDRLEIPVYDHRLWGKATRGTVAVVRWPGGTGIGTRSGSEPRIGVEIGGAECRWIEILAIRSESSDPLPPTASAAWILHAVPIFQRRAERQLETFAEGVFRRQQKQGCFSCHQIMPLFSAAAIARERGFQVPEALLASITEHLIPWQNVDGSFAWPDHPEYGTISPTAVAAASLALLSVANPGAEAALQRSIRFLVNRQKEDGSLHPDFTCAGFITGPEFTTRCLLEALSAGASSLARLGRSEPPACTEARRRARSWLDRLAAETGPARELAWLALPLAGRFPEASRTEVLETVGSLLRGADFTRDPARTAWFTRQLVLLGGVPPVDLAADLVDGVASVSPRLRDSVEAREIWKLMAAIWVHFHREANREICR